MVGRRRMWVRWSWRDLRRRWGQVAAIALIISIGTGTYAGLGGTSSWRLRSHDASYAQLRYHDVRAALPETSFAPAGSLAAAARSIDHVEDLAAIEERLIVSVQIDASVGGKTVLVPGRVVGAATDTSVDQLLVTEGRAAVGRAASAPAAEPEAVLESKFAAEQGLERTGAVRISGDRTVRYVGLGYSPEYFMVLGSAGLLTGPGDFGVLFVPLADAQVLTGHAGMVNNVAIRFTPGVNEDVVFAELKTALEGVGARVEAGRDDPVHVALYADARNDEQTWNFLAGLILLGATFAAFNLITRMVEAERHEFGVGMAIGASPATLAIRPLLVGIQIALLGAVAGIGIGIVAAKGMKSVLETALPMPVWETPFPLARYSQAAAFGLLLPIVATVIPVARVMRTEPVDAMHTIPRGIGGRRAGLAPLLRRMRLRGHVVALMPFRNVLRAPRRTLFTALGIAAAITTLVVVLGMIDSIAVTLDRSDTELAQRAPRRLEVGLDRFYLAGSPEVAALAESPVTARAQPSLRLAGRVRAHGETIDVVVELLDWDEAMWTPTIAAGARPGPDGGVVLSEKAAADLGVVPGDTVVLHHPVRRGLSLRLVDTTLPVAGIHPNPLRFLAYLEADRASLFGLQGIVDAVVVDPAPGVTVDDAKRALFPMPGVTSVQQVAGLSEIFDRSMDQIKAVLQMVELFALALALLIAFNSARIAVDERRREQATMFAFGLRVRTVMGVLTTESVITGLLGSVLGTGLGYLALRSLVNTLTSSTLPELGMVALLSGPTVATTIVLGVGAVALAPLFALRRLLRTDIPASLRVLE